MRIAYLPTERRANSASFVVLIALKHVGSNRIVNLETVEEDSSMWSLLIVNRHEVHTKCLILKPKQ